MKIVAIEGIDNAGKTTICKEIQSYFKDDKRVFCSYEFDSDIGQYINENISSFSSMEKTLLFACDRALRWEKLKQYDVVVFDRYIYSSYVYREMEKEDIVWVKEVNKKFNLPDLNVYVDVTLDEVVRRDGYIPYSMEELAQCRKIYLNYVEKKELQKYKGLEWLISEIKKLL